MLKSAIPDSMLAPLGRVVVYYGLLEDSVTLLAAELTGIGQLEGRLLLRRRRLEELTTLCEVLAEQHTTPASWHEQWMELARAIDEATEQRNDLIHAQWAAGTKPDTARAAMFTGRKDLRVRHAEWDVERVNAIADRCAELASNVTRMSFQIESIVTESRISDGTITVS